MRDSWGLYDALIEGVPGGIRVADWCLGTRWAYVDAECGMGLSLTVNGGVGRYGLADADKKHDLRGLATYVKSWNFREASVGAAALNAWYSAPDRLAAAGVELGAGDGRGDDAFRVCRPQLVGRKVAVVGHFPSVEELAEDCELTVLERSPLSPADLPDSACEYVLPRQDVVFITGTTITNKTVVRLLELSQEPRCILVGPSVVPSELLFEAGADVIGGSVVLDPPRVRRLVERGAAMLFGDGVRMVHLERERAWSL